jgi:hypothetical protein
MHANVMHAYVMQAYVMHVNVMHAYVMHVHAMSCMFLAGLKATRQPVLQGLKRFEGDSGASFFTSRFFSS